MPRDVGRRVDFASADRTVLAAHISARYPELADKLARTTSGGSGTSELAKLIQTIHRQP